MRYHHFVTGSLPVVFALLLSGCALSRLDNGAPSAMDLTSNDIRNATTVSPNSPTLHMVYRVHGICRYSVQMSGMDGTGSSVETYSFSPHRDRIFFSSKSSAPIDGFSDSGFASISRSGRMIDYNAHLVGQGVALSDTPQTAQQVDRTLVQKEAAKQSGLLAVPKSSIHELDENSVLFPHYVSKFQYPGTTVAYVMEAGGTPYGSIIYRGTTSYAGHRVELLDFLRAMPAASSSPVTIGFGLYDIPTGLPVMVDISAGSTTIYRLTSCRG